MKDKICILPWISKSIGTDGKVSPCCQYQSDSSADLNALRKRFLKGECPSECVQCFALEESGGQSMRMLKNQEYQRLLSHELSEQALELTEFDVRFSNICQLSCLTCEPYYSTGWYQYEKHDPIADKGKVLRSFEKADEMEKFISEQGAGLKIITISGGEPFIEPMTLEFLKSMENKNIEINLNTGLMLSDKTLKKNLVQLKQFKKYRIAVSLDAIGEEAEKIRRGLDWNLFLSNLELLKKELGEENLYFQLTCSNLNAGKISEVLSWIHENHQSMLRRTTLNFVRYPELFDPQKSSPELRNSWISTNNKVMKQRLFEGLSDDEHQHILKLISLVNGYLK